MSLSIKLLPLVCFLSLAPEVLRSSFFRQFNSPLRSLPTMFRHSVSRASLLTSSAVRTSKQSSFAAPRFVAAARSLHTSPIQRDAATTAPPPASGSRSEHALSNPLLANIDKRWDKMPPQEQAELWMAVRDRMVVDWHQLTHQEKRAGKSTKNASGTGGLCEIFAPSLVKTHKGAGNNAFQESRHNTRRDVSSVIVRSLRKSSPTSCLSPNDH